MGSGPLAQKQKKILILKVHILKQSRDILFDLPLNPHVDFISSLPSEFVLLEAFFM